MPERSSTGHSSPGRSPAGRGPTERAGLPREAVLLGFDFGTRRIGVAIGNTLTRSARPLRTVPAEPGEQRFARIGDLIRSWHPVLLVVGRPMHADGTPNATTPKCERFARQLGGRFGLPVELVDERYSSVAGDGDDRDDDAQAAATILRQYLSGS
jgi:putative Holliday junction resolvase